MELLPCGQIKEGYGRLFENQHGVIHRRQALAAGMTRGSIQKKLEVGLVVEVDSWTWHADKPTRRADARHQNHLDRLGSTVLRFFREDVLYDPGYVLSEIRATLVALSRDTFGD